MTQLTYVEDGVIAIINGEAVWRIRKARADVSGAVLQLPCLAVWLLGDADTGVDGWMDFVA